MWELEAISGLPNDRQNEGQILSFRFPTPQIKTFDIGQNVIVGSGPSFPYLCIKQLQQSDYQLYRLPNNARGVDQLAFLTDKLLLGYISEGIFCLLDLGQLQNQTECTKLQLALQIRLPNALIKRFAIDHPMNALALTATNGNVFLYNLPVAI